MASSRKMPLEGSQLTNDRGRSSLTLTGLCALALLALVLARAAQIWVAHIGCEQTWDDGAVQLARDIHYSVNGAAIYSDFRRPPYYAQEYGPVIPIAAAPVAGHFGSSVFACLRIGRCLTIIATVAALCSMVLLAGRFSSVQASLIAIAGFALTPVFFPWFSEFRVDTAALFFEIGGLYAVSVGGDAIAIPLFVLAFMTKQTYVAGIAAALLMTRLGDERKRSLVLGGGYLALTAIAVAIVQYADPFYLLNTFASHVPWWDFAAPPELLGRVLLAMSPLVLMTFPALWHRDPARNLMLCYLLTSGVSCCFFSIRWGSDLNYFLEFAAAVAIFASAGIDRLLSSATTWPRLRQAALGFALAGLIACPLLVTKKLSVHRLISLDFKPPAIDCDRGWNPDAFRVLSASGGPILTTLPDISLRIEHQVWAPEFDVLRSMRSRGMFDDRELTDLIAQKRFAAIVLEGQGLNREYRGRRLLWPELRAVIEQNYTRSASAGLPYVMLPKKQQTAAAPANSE